MIPPENAPTANMQKCLQEMGFQYEGARDFVYAFPRMHKYMRALEKEHRALRNALQAALFVMREEEKNDQAVLAADAILKSLTLLP